VDEQNQSHRITPAMSKLIARLAKQRKEPNVQLGVVSRERDQLEERNRELEIECEKLKKELGFSVKNLGISDKKMEKMKDQLSARDRQILALQTMKSETVVKSGFESDNVISENRRLKAKIDELEEQILLLRDSKSKAETLTIQSVNEYEKELEKARKEMMKDKAANASLLDENAILKRKLKEEKNEKKRFEQELEKLRKALEISEKKVTLQAGVIKTLTAEVSKT
jgi:chromosome segregation ATPase